MEFSAGASAYIPMPWGCDRRRHVLAFHLGGGVGTTDRGERALFSLGGFPDFNPPACSTSSRGGGVGGGIALRGTSPTRASGSQFRMANVEYRFPVLQPQRGLSTFRSSSSSFWASVFADAGHAAFGRFDWENVAVGAGAEVFADLVVGFVVPLTVRAGYAHGFMDDGEDQFYALLGNAF